MANILVTGGAGFIGCALTSALLEAGHELAVIDSLSPQVHKKGKPSRLPKDLLFLPGDVTHAENWFTSLRLFRPEVVVHLAAETGTAQSLSSVSLHSRVNVGGTGEMLDALLAQDCVPDHIVLASSRAVYGEGRWQAAGETFYPGPRIARSLEAGIWDPELPKELAGFVAEPMRSSALITEARPTNVYGATKLAQENLLIAWCSALGCSCSILRFQNVYGPGQAPANPHTGLVTLFASIANDKGVIDVYEDGRMLRDFVYLDDAVNALAATIERSPSSIRLSDIGDGTETSILELAEMIAAITGAPRPKISGRYRPGDVRAAFCDISPARADLGYSPAWTLERGLKALLEWISTEIY